jgi:hypothetical protein
MYGNKTLNPINMLDEYVLIKGKKEKEINKIIITKKSLILKKVCLGNDNLYNLFTIELFLIGKLKTNHIPI